MTGWVEEIWAKYKREKWPLVSGQQEKDLRTAFMQGMWLGTRVLTDASELPKNQMKEFVSDYGKQLGANLAEMGERLVKLNIRSVAEQIKKN